MCEGRLCVYRAHLRARGPQMAARWLLRPHSFSSRRRRPTARSPLLWVPAFQSCSEAPSLGERTSQVRAQDRLCLHSFAENVHACPLMSPCCSVGLSRQDLCQSSHFLPKVPPPDTPAIIRLRGQRHFVSRDGQPSQKVKSMTTKTGNICQALIHVKHQSKLLRVCAQSLQSWLTL